MLTQFKGESGIEIPNGQFIYGASLPAVNVIHTFHDPQQRHSQSSNNTAQLDLILFLASNANALFIHRVISCHLLI
jgi:hypothetical protein